MFKVIAANFLLKYDLFMVWLGSIGAVIGFIFGSLFGCLIASFHKSFLNGYLRAATSHKETLEFLYYKEMAKSLKKDK